MGNVFEGDMRAGMTALSETAGIWHPSPTEHAPMKGCDACATAKERKREVE